MSTDAAGAMLDASARIGIEQTTFPELDKQYLQSINLLLHFTKAAIVVHWLRIIDHRYSDPRAKAILGTFERLTFSSVPSDNKTIAVLHVENLVKATLNLEQIMHDKTISQQDWSRLMLQWCKKWLGLVDTDSLFLNHVTLIYGMDLMIYLRDSMQLLGNAVESVVFEKDRP